jgi:hypothetical protein
MALRQEIVLYETTARLEIKRKMLNFAIEVEVRTLRTGSPSVLRNCERVLPRAPAGAAVESR